MRRHDGRRDRARGQRLHSEDRDADLQPGRDLAHLHGRDRSATRKAESTETFTVVLSNPNGASIGRGTGTVTIIDNDSALVVAAGSARLVGTTVSAADIGPALAAAKAWWARSGLDTDALDGVTVVVADLPGLALGEADGRSSGSTATRPAGAGRSTAARPGSTSGRRSRTSWAICSGSPTTPRRPSP